MPNRLTASLAAAAIAVSSIFAAPAPARAGEDDVIKFILGAAALGLILNEASKHAPVARAQTAPRHGVAKPQRYAPPVHAQSRHWRQDRWQGDRHRRVVPASCLFDIHGRYGPRPVVGARCVQRWNARADLPRACAFEVNRGARDRTVYGLRCLRDRGYRIVRG